ncbi:MAG: sulfite exporter TauE/SafE family protein [Candidatus Fimenecus sp.]
MIFVVYGVLIFAATCMGAFVGLGGGVIIKPVLDVINAHPLEQIAFFSSCAVFVMSITSTAKHLRNKTPIDKKTVLFSALGSVAGGFAGNRIFDVLLKSTGIPNVVRGIQSALLGALLIAVIVLVNINIKHLKLKNPISMIIAGFLLGSLASFLGIGGGPINVAVFTLLFSLTMRDAAVCSVAVIFFSQFTNLTVSFLTAPVFTYDLKMLLAIIPCAVLGGLLGAKLNRAFPEKVIRVTFSVTVSAVAALSIYNSVSSFIN